MTIYSEDIATVLEDIKNAVVACKITHKVNSADENQPWVDVENQNVVINTNALIVPVRKDKKETIRTSEGRLKYNYKLLLGYTGIVPVAGDIVECGQLVATIGEVEIIEPDLTPILIKLWVRQ